MSHISIHFTETLVLISLWWLFISLHKVFLVWPFGSWWLVFFWASFLLLCFPLFPANMYLSWSKFQCSRSSKWSSIVLVCGCQSVLIKPAYVAMFSLFCAMPTVPCQVRSVYICQNRGHVTSVSGFPIGHHTRCCFHMWLIPRTWLDTCYQVF